MTYISNLLDHTLEDTYILHIPHAGNEIPNFDNYLLPKEKIIQEHYLLTDLGTNKLFNTPFTSLLFPYSRVYCDVERLPDEQEEMFAKGRGFYYTHTDNGELLRSIKEKNEVKKIYENWHLKLEKSVQKKLDKYGTATIIDCHSFADIPFSSDLDQSKNRPDFCLGTDNFHTPAYLLNFIKQRLENEGYSVHINSPYSGTIVPLKYYKTNNNVHSIMVEVNRKLFQKGNTLLADKVTNLNKMLNNILQYEEYTLP